MPLNPADITWDEPQNGAPMTPDQYDRSTWDKRPDGTAKGTGFLGVIKRPDGTVSSEISVGVPINGKEMDIPTMVPGLTPTEMHWLLTTPVDRVAKELPDSIRQKAIAHAQERISQGLSPFKQDNEGDVASTPDPSAVQWDAPTDTPDLSQLNDHMRSMFHAGASTADILAYGKQHNLYPNPDEIEHARKNHLDVQFVQPQQADKGMGQQLIDATKNDVAGIGQGAAALPDIASEAVGKVLSAIPNVISHALSAAGHTDAADWIQNNITHNLANPVQIGDAIESASPTPDSASGEVARFLSQMAGGAVTVPAAATESLAARLVGDAPKVPAVFKVTAKAGDAPAAVETAHAANDLGIDLPRFVVGGAKDAKRASALEQTVGGAKPISDATQKMLDQSSTALDTISSNVGKSAEPAALGDQALNAAVGTVKSERARIGNIYEQAKTAAAGTTAQPIATRQTINDLIANEREVPGGTKVLPILEHYEKAFEDGAPMSIDGARGLRTTLRTRLRDEAGVTPDNADRITNLVMGSVNKDITGALQTAGKDGAANLYRQADAQWAQQRSVEDDVLKPFLGKNFDNWGEDVAKKINSDVKGNGTRLARFLSVIPEDEANNARASLISHLGSAGDGAQNAAGDAFSLDTFLTNWNKIKGARNLVFSKDTVQSLDKLAKVAEAAKMAGRTRNRSNTGGVVSYLMSGAPMAAGGAETLLTGDPKGVALGMLYSGFNTVRQYGAAKLLASPSFAKKLAATPLNPAGAQAFWSRSWVKAMAVKNPVIAGELLAFQKAILTHANDNSIVSSASASPDAEQQQQQ